MDAVRTPKYIIKYNGNEISKYISDQVLSVSYTDNEEGKSDDLSIQIEDSQALWKNGWYPQKGDKLSVSAGYENEQLYDFGNFEIDEITFSGPPDIVDIKAVATPITAALRQNNTKAYEETTLIDIANEIGQKHGFTVIGTQGAVKIERITQNQERDLAFLKRLANQYGYIFKITDKKLVFYKVEDIETRNAVYTIKRSEVSDYRLTDSSTEQYKSVEVSYYSSKKKKVIKKSVQNENISGKKGDVLKLNVRAESPAQAKEMAQAALKQSHDFQIEGDISMFGVPTLRSGNTVILEGFGKLNGKYRIVTSTHTMDKSGGYKTSISIKKVIG